ncbi:ornithine carbamoyltransferase [Desulfobaculum bizertense]|uniref:ornithine carbamoyltransferase n=1 Tax=Desulfobaculum bizertense TaxID=376490 RepID=UPI001F355E38|nr:ornithine carbamoyltransferase [Desulfobaculum bizertense]UIJ38060.1 ornithine carbamoyltransferase [Desulfobaculum bizertense]
MSRHFLSILDLDREQAHALVRRAHEMKRTDCRTTLLSGKTVAMIFEKASTRTRVSFEVGIRHLGGSPLLMTPAESQLGRNEPLRDTARVLSRFCAGMVVRTLGQEKLDELSEWGSVPVVNALTDSYHPCQVMSDMLTMYENTPEFEGLKVAWVGDGNNMAHSFINAAVHFPFELALAVPEGFDPDPEILEKARSLGANITVTRDPREACRGAHYINTDVWASMGQEEEQKAREKAFAGFQVNDDLMALADPQAKFMHCLPAHRGEEVSESVLEGPQSIIFDQAENRLHMQKAILEWVFSE